MLAQSGVFCLRHPRRPSEPRCYDAATGCQIKRWTGGQFAIPAARQRYLNMRSEEHNAFAVKFKWLNERRFAPPATAPAVVPASIPCAGESARNCQRSLLNTRLNYA